MYIDSRLWVEWAAIPFLARESEAVVVASEQAIPSVEPDRQGGVLLLVWPYGQVERFLPLLPVQSVVEAHRGPLARGDLEEEARTAYLSFAAQPAGAEMDSRLAYFGDSIALVGYEVDTDCDDWRVTLQWSALEGLAEDYTVFVHLRDGERLVAQHDGLPAGGLYPTALWRPGDVIVDGHVLEGCGERLESGLSLVIGLYSWPAIDRLPVTSSSGELLGDGFTIRIEN